MYLMIYQLKKKKMCDLIADQSSQMIQKDSQSDFKGQYTDDEIHQEVNGMTPARTYLGKR